MLSSPCHVNHVTKLGKSPNSTLNFNTEQRSVIMKCSVSQNPRTSNAIVNNRSEKVNELRALAGISFTDSEWPGTMMLDTAHATRFVKV